MCKYEERERINEERKGGERMRIKKCECEKDCDEKRRERINEEREERKMEREKRKKKYRE